MSFLFVVAHPASGAVLQGLARACQRQNQAFTCFFTGDGVTQLTNQQVLQAIADAQRAVVCEHSWARHFPDTEPPVESGSQTTHSVMAGEAQRVVSL